MKKTFVLIAVISWRLSSHADSFNARTYWLLTREAWALQCFAMEQKEVQDALALSADQVGELKKAGIGDVSLEVANTQYMPAQKKGVDRDETGRAAMRPHEVYTSSIERVLSPEQKERFEQILLQIQGPKVIVENEVFARMLSIDDGQKKEMT